MNRTPSNLVHQLERVLEAAERLDRACHRLAAARRQRCTDCRRRHHVAHADAVRRGESPSAERAARRPPPCAGTMLPPLTTKPSSSGARARTASAARARSPRQLQHQRIVGVDDRPVARRLIGEDARLRVAVLLDRRVPIEVIGREVQEHGDPGVERRARLELKAADFDDVDRVGVRLRDLRAERQTDVAADERRPARPRAASGRSASWSSTSPSCR